MTRLFILAILSMTCISCVASQETDGNSCSVHRIDDVLQRPLFYKAGTFCGEVFVVRYRGSVRLLPRNDLPADTDIALLPTQRSIPRLGLVSDVPRPVTIKARVDPQEECFVPAQSREVCSPYPRPIIFDIEAVQESG